MKKPQHTYLTCSLLTQQTWSGFSPTTVPKLSTGKEGRQSRSTKLNLLAVPRTKCVTFGDRAFSVYAPTQWNKLPLDIRSIDCVETFKSAVKTYLFRKYFC